MKLETSSFLLIGVAVVIVVAVPIGIHRPAQRADFKTEKSRMLSIAVALAMIAWLIMTGLLAHSGWLAVWSSVPPRIPLLPLTVLSTLFLVGRTQVFKRLLAVTPLWWPVAFSTIRVFVELAFWMLHQEGNAPVQVTFEGTNHDGWVGLMAPFIAIAIARRWIGKFSLIAWNVFGIAMLGTAGWSNVTSVPGPFHLDWPGEPFVEIATWPVIWIPAFFAPCALFMHITSIRQALSKKN